MAKKLTHQEFVVKAIPTLRTEGFKGIHTVYSGFNNAFKAYFGADVEFPPKGVHLLFGGMGRGRKHKGPQDDQGKDIDTGGFVLLPAA